MVIAGASIVWRHLSDGAAVQQQTEVSKTASVSWKSRLYWMAAAFVPSALMLAVTNHMLLNLASVPFLWVIPLAAYLITFMIAFGRRFHLSPVTLSQIVPVVLLILFPLVAADKSVSANLIWYILGSHVLVLFAGALLCHTALASRRPDTQHLTEFYFWVALGGALGGIFTAVIAPFIFKTVVEYPLLVAMIAFFRQKPNPEEKRNIFDWIYPALLGLLILGAWYGLQWAKVEDLMDTWKLPLSIDGPLVLIAFLSRK